MSSSIRHDLSSGVLLRNGSRGPMVMAVQQCFLTLGYLMPLSTARGTKTVDGIFGNETTKIVVFFQTKHDLIGDGVVGPRTTSKLLTVLSDLEIFEFMSVVVDLMESLSMTNATTRQQMREIMGPNFYMLTRSYDAIANATRPYNLPDWRSLHIPPVSTFQFGSPKHGSQEFGFFLPAIPITYWAVMAAAATATAIAIHATQVISKNPPSIPKPNLNPPSTEIGPIIIDAIVMMTIKTLEAQGAKILGIITGWLANIDLYRDSRDPRCQEAIQEAQMAIAELRSVVQVAIHAGKTGAGYGAGYYKRLLDRLGAKYKKALEKMLDMHDACRIHPPLAP